MVDGIHRRLDPKQTLGVADMGAQVFGHRVEWLQQSRKSFGEGLNNRIPRVAQVEIDRALVSIEHCFDGVTNIISTLLAQRLGIRKAVRNRVAVDDPK